MENITKINTQKIESQETGSLGEGRVPCTESQVSVDKSCFPRAQAFSREVLQELFNELDPSNEWDIAIMEDYNAKDDRIGVLVDFKPFIETEWRRGIVDFRRHPSFQQVLDLVYDRGADCDIKALLFDDASPTSNATEDLYVVTNLVKLLNRYGLNVFLVQAENVSSVPGEDSICFTEIQGPPRFIARNGVPVKLPKKRKLQEVEFWVCYYDLESGFTNSVVYEPQRWLDFGSSYSLMDCIVSIEWTDAGIFMTAVPEFDGGKDALNWFRNEGLEKLQKEYEGCEIKFYEKKGVPTKLTVKIDGKPIRSIFNATSEVKMEYAGMIRTEEFRFLEFFQELGYEEDSDWSLHKEEENICGEV